MNFGSFQTQSQQTITDEQRNEFKERFRGKTVQEVLEYFETKLEKQEQKYLKTSRFVLRADRTIFECLEYLAHLNDQTKKLEQSFEDLNVNFDKLQTEQRSLIDDLSNDNTPAQKSSAVIDRRLELYQTAESLHNDLLNMQKELDVIFRDTKNMERKVNNDDIEKIRKIANFHFKSMTYIEKTTNTVDEKIEKLKQKLALV